MTSRKTVYIIGAGYSYDAGYPLQTDILKKVLDYKFSILSGRNEKAFDRLSNIFLPAKESYKYMPEQGAYTYIPPSHTTLIEFLNRVFSSNSNSSLEDIFTLLDQSIAKRTYCLGYPWSDLEMIRTIFQRAILIIFHNMAEMSKNEITYRSIAAYLLRQRISSGKRGDPFSIISLNWDSLIEDSIYWCLMKVKGYKISDVDYCTYTFPLTNSSKHVTSIIQRAKGINNIKILKLHGSTNWLLCPNCNRLYTGLGSKENVWDLYVEERFCEKCATNKWNIQDKPPILEPFFITPTYTKVFDNTHLQSVWDNAYIELSEADRIVFIGYSLPDADYHFRTLLHRSIASNTRVEVVLMHNDYSYKRMPLRQRRYLASNRYKNFFGKQEIKWYKQGVRGYFKSIISKRALANNLKYIKEHI